MLGWSDELEPPASPGRRNWSGRWEPAGKSSRISNAHHLSEEGDIPCIIRVVVDVSAAAVVSRSRVIEVEQKLVLMVSASD